ncbi:MAG: PIG-L deacetylase family protein [Streptosporangiales bacterium]
MSWLGLVIGCAYALLGASIVINAAWMRRHLRHPTLVRAVVGLGSLAGLPSGIVLAWPSMDGALTWEPYVVGLDLLLLLGLLVLLFSARRVGKVSSHARRVLVVATHPDDLELACGGTLARFVDHGHEVRAIIMSHGAAGGREDNREREAYSGAEVLDLAGVSVREFTDTMMATEINKMVGVVELAIDLFQPDIVITHSAHDQHQDHHAVHLATVRAARRCTTVLCFESPSADAQFTPQYFVDIGDYVDVKIDSVKAHHDQAGKPYMSPEHLRGLATFRGSQAKVRHAEGFEVLRGLSSGLGDL